VWAGEPDQMPPVTDLAERVGRVATAARCYEIRVLVAKTRKDDDQ
jgi:hypothetical protein